MRLLRVACLPAGLAFLAFASTAALAQDVRVGALIIGHPWARATPGGAQVGGGYLAIVNKGTTPDRLMGGSFSASSGFALHQMSMDGGIMRMRPTGPLEIPPGGTLTLDPKGIHIMFTGLKRGLKKGETIDGTLVFEHAGTVPVRFVVEGIGAMKPAETGGSEPPGHAMPGMDAE